MIPPTTSTFDTLSRCTNNDVDRSWCRWSRAVGVHASKAHLIRHEASFDLDHRCDASTDELSAVAGDMEGKNDSAVTRDSPFVRLSKHKADHRGRFKDPRRVT